MIIEVKTQQQNRRERTMTKNLSWYDYLQMAPAAESKADLDMRLSIYGNMQDDIQRQHRQHKISTYDAAKNLNAIANLELAFRHNSSKAGYREEITA
jgi:hypothetical protein